MSTPHIPVIHPRSGRVLNPGAHLDHTDSQQFPTVTQVDSRIPELVIYATHDCPDGVARKIGIAIDTPSGLMLWVNDVDADPANGRWQPLHVGLVDDMDSARRHARENDLILHPLLDGVAPVGG